MKTKSIKYKFIFPDLPPIILSFQRKVLARQYCKEHHCSELHQETRGTWYKIKKTG